MAEQQKVKKGAKKSFYEVATPLTSSKVHLYGTGVESFDGKTVKIDLTRSLKGKSFELRLRVLLREGKLESEPMSLNLAGSYIRKIFRNGIDYVEDSFEAECRDCIARVKPFLMTRRRVSRKVCRALRNDAKSYLSGYLKARTSNEIFSEIMSNKLQKQLFTVLKKVYPLALCEIRVFEIESKKAFENAAEKVAEKIVEKETAPKAEVSEVKEEVKKEKKSKEKKEKKENAEKAD